MTGPLATRLFRIMLALAGGYNIAFGLWAALWPMHFFELVGIAAPRYPQVWACLGMVLGLYGLLYWYAAWWPERGRPIVAVGLIGKVLGPIGMVLMFNGDWPPRLGMICVYNDLIWWLPFALFLLRGTAVGRRLGPASPWLCATAHFAGLIVMGLILRHGLIAEPALAERARFIAEHTAAWAAGWAVWMLAALTLLGFYAWWGSRLDRRHLATAAVLVGAVGVVCDLSGEALSVLVLPELAEAAPADDAAAFERVERLITLLTAGAANTLYAIAGLTLMLLTPDLPRAVRLTMWATWLSAGVMTVAAIADDARAMAAATVVLFPTLLVWLVWMGARWRRP